MNNNVKILKEVDMVAGEIHLKGDLFLPDDALGLVIFAHGSGSSRFSSRNRYVASVIQNAGIGTLLFDLLMKEEERAERHTRHLRFDIPLLTERLEAIVKWALSYPDTNGLPIGLFGASTGAAAALSAAASLGDTVAAVVSRGGRPDLADKALPNVTAPVLLIVGGHDGSVIELNEIAYREINSEKELKIVRGATHLFEEPGALEAVADMAAEWFKKYLKAHRRSEIRPNAAKAGV